MDHLSSFYHCLLFYIYYFISSCLFKSLLGFLTFKPQIVAQNREVFATRQPGRAAFLPATLLFYLIEWGGAHYGAVETLFLHFTELMGI